MKIKKISIVSYRGIKERQNIPLSNLSSIVGKNDSGKSIILNAIASFLDPKEFPITESDFNDNTKPIKIACYFGADNLREQLESKIKSKIKKNDGLDEFLNGLIFDDEIIFIKTVNAPKKGFDTEKILFKDYDETEFSMLYSKSDEELTEIVTKNKIEIPVDGKGRNSKLEKIKHIKLFCKDKKIIERLIDDEYKIASLFPVVELFKSDYGLEADTKFKTTSVSEIQNYFEREAATDDTKLKQVEKEIEGEMQIEAQSIKTYMNDYVSSLNNVEIKPTINWKDAIKSVDVSFQFDGDSKPIPMSHKGTGYRRLFMVARFRFLAEKNKGKNITYLIEEPETFLHPSAQEDLLNAFRDLSTDNQIILTTHSPVFAGATNLNSVILCKKNSQSVYEYATAATENEFIDKIVVELGIKPSYNLKDHHEKIVFVESSNDIKFYEIVCQQLLGSALLGSKKTLVLPFGGGEDIESFLNIEYFGKSGRELFLIIDSDKQQNNESKQNQRAADFVTGKAKNKAYVIFKSCIENYYHPRTIERVYGLPANTFDFISPEANARNYIKSVIADKTLGNNNIKEKNNFKIFEQMTKEEWEELVEKELSDFLKEIIS
jgi:putative ATP-dependent endonuclease of the OLD family